MFLALALQIVLAAPQPIVELDTARLKGDVARLAWSPDAGEFYVQTVDRDRQGRITGVRHYLVTRLSKSVKSIDAEPPWASKYWAWKAAQASPGSAAFRIDVAQHEETVSATASPTGGSLAKGGAANPNLGTTVEDVANAANQTQRMLVSDLKVSGEAIGTWVNEPVIPGFSFGWAPAPLKLLAFTRRERKDGGPIVVIDQSGQKQELDAARNAVLPAWSDDAKQLAWLERKDRKRFVLMIADIEVR